VNKIIPVVVISLLIINGLGAVAYNGEDNKTLLTRNEHFTIAQPEIGKLQENEFITIEIEDTTQLMSTGKPMIPVVVKTLKLPVGSIIEETNVDIEYQPMNLEYKIQPSPAPTVLTTESLTFDEDHYDIYNEAIYESSELYPAEPYTVRYGVGLDSGELVTYVNIRCNAQYAPANDLINIPSKIDITVDYTTPDTSPIGESEYELLIITHEKFEDEMLRLKNHKDSIGVGTTVVTVDEIYTAYSGVAEWEEVKMFIADMVENQGYTNVILAGGHMGQTEEYWVPEFRSLNFDGAYSGSGVPYDPDYCSDLYFADLFEYDNKGNPMFSSWDTNEDGIYAKGPRTFGRDDPDYYPDVALGRIPFRYSWEAKAVVDKIITYETVPMEDTWFNKVILCGGDTSPEERYGTGSVTRGIYEGELICDETAKYMASAGFDPIKLYTSPAGDHQLNEGEDGDGSDEVSYYMNNGCSWVNMQGHASPLVIGNHVEDREDFIYYYTMLDMIQFDSDGKYPFMVVDGCHNAQYDVTLQQAINAGGLNYDRVGFSEYLPTDIGSWMVLREDGGGIALIGNTALGYGYLDRACTLGLGGWMSPRWSHAYAEQGKEYFGEIWVQGLTDYINNFPVWTDDVDRKILEERSLLGDPSIRFGGMGIVPGTGEDPDVPEYNPAQRSNAPEWVLGDSWTYKVHDIEFTMQELDDRGIDLSLSTGNIKLEVVDVTASSYVTDISCDNIAADIEFYFNSYTENETEINIPPVSLKNVALQGQIVWEQSSLAIRDVDISLIFDVIDNIEGLPIELPSFVYQLLPYMSIPVQVDLSIDFDDAFPLFDFPLEEGDEWGIPEGQGVIMIDGSVSSPWLRLVKIVNRFVPLIPQNIARHLPNIDISELLDDMGIPPVIDLELSEMREILRKTWFTVAGEETVNVEAGTYTATRIKIAGGVGNLYYSDEAKTFVQLYCPTNDLLPAINNINIELVE
jgi:hypothetical protein